MMLNLAPFFVVAVFGLHFAVGDIKGVVLRHRSKRKIEPACSMEISSNPKGSCCLDAVIDDPYHFEVDLCIELSVKHGKPELALTAKGKAIIDTGGEQIEICAPIPGAAVEACLNVYHVEINKHSVEICSYLSLSLKSFIGTLGGIDVDFGCIKISFSGEINFNHDYTPNPKGIFNLEYSNGKISFKVRNPIPQHVVDDISKNVNYAAKEVEDASKDVENFGKSLADDFSSFFG